jgi:23S rRNA G2069 N7-methylase RlmK/C1962 C5-methylase RlmI
MIIGMFLGMVMVLGILGVAVMVRMYSNIKKLKRELRGQEQINQSIYHRFDELDQMINRRIDGEIRRTDDLFTETNRYINGRMDDVDRMILDVYSNMDSRLDKLTNKLSPVKKDLLKD